MPGPLYFDSLSSDYVSLSQRLSLFASSSTPVPAGLQPIPGGTAALIVPLAGQQAFRIVHATAEVGDFAATGKLKLQSLAIAWGPTLLGKPSRATMGLELGAAGVFSDIPATPIYLWNDFQAQGGITPSFTIFPIGDVLNTDIIAHNINVQMTAIVELYQVAPQGGAHVVVPFVR